MVPLIQDTKLPVTHQCELLTFLFEVLDPILGTPKVHICVLSLLHDPDSGGQVLLACGIFNSAFTVFAYPLAICYLHSYSMVEKRHMFSQGRGKLMCKLIF